MILLKRLILMIQFLTTIPLPVNLEVKQEDFGKGLVFAPVIGLLLGGMLALAYYVLRLVFPAYAAVVFVIIFYILLTGGLHLDGLGDTFDGLFSNRPKERILEIMRDSRVGTNAVLAIVCVLLLNLVMLTGINQAFIVRAIVLMPVAGRIGSLVGAGSSRYARSSEGLGKSFIDFCGFKEIITGFIIYSIIFFCIAGWKGLLIGIIPAVFAFAAVKFLGRKIGGATGDILGAVCELNQTFFLIFINIILAAGFKL